ncbi:MAG: RNA polymerase factor sigma-54 [Bacteroidales bacterium]|nr:RNA polymerase factor sigma-54 [Bacteroidales bacterium]
MKQVTTIRQVAHLAPQQILIAKMVQATSDELEQLITAETEKNLALEIEDGAMSAGNAEVEEADTDSRDIDQSDAPSDEDIEGELSPSDDAKDDSYAMWDDDGESQPAVSADNAAYSPLLNYKSGTTFREELLEQLNEMELSEEDAFLARFLVDSLDDNGYLTRSLTDLVDDLAFTQMHDTTEDNLQRVLTEVVQMLEPTGIGARNLRECLLLQLQEKKATPAVQLAYDIVDQAFEDLSARRFERMCTRFNVSTRQLSEAQRIISHLDPKPGGQSATADLVDIRASHIKPDFSIHAEDGELVVSVNDAHIPTVRISPDYQIMMERIQQSASKSEDSRQGLSMIRESITSGNQFIDALRQRRETLSRVIRVIAQMQSSYFLSGGNLDELRPMVLQEVADRSGYDVSTISRVSNSKYIETDFGIIPVKDLFSTAIQTESGSISNVAVQEALRELIEHEDKRAPLSDDALSEQLKAKGYPVARRTVAKYREQLNFPSARLRREV